MREVEERYDCLYISFHPVLHVAYRGMLLAGVSMITWWTSGVHESCLMMTFCMNFVAVKAHPVVFQVHQTDGTAVPLGPEHECAHPS
jgi:hypothetical protein